MDPARRNEKQTRIDGFDRRADDRIQRKQTQKQLLADIKQKNTQLSVLNHVNTRLGAELVILQKKLGIDHDKILKELQEINQISAAFHFETQQLQYLDALLTAYDENNIKQKKLIAHLYSSLEDAEKKTQNLIKDNQFLLGQLQDKTKQILQIYSKGFVDDNLTSSYNKLQRQTQIQMMENIRVQNQYLLRNYRVLEDKIEKKEKQLKQATKKSDYYFQLYKKQSEDVKQSLIKIEDLLKIKDVLERKFDEVTQENIELQTIREQLETKITRIQNQSKQLRNQFNLQRTVKHEEIERVSEQFTSLKAEHDASEKRQRQYFNKNMLLEKDLQNQRDQLKVLRRELEKTKSDFEQTLKMCQAYETKINVYSKKQIIVRETVQDCKQKLENALLERDKAIMKQKQFQKSIENIKQRHRDEMQTLKTTYEKILMELNEKIKILEEDKQDSNSVFYQNQCSLKHQIEKLKRDNQLLKEENYRHTQSIKTNSGTQIISKLKELEEKNQTLSRMLNQKERVFRQDVDHKDEIIRDLENNNRDLSRQVDKERASARQAINERTQYKSKISMLEKQKECLEDEISKLRRNFDSRASAQNEQKLARIRDLQEKLSESVQREKLTKQKTIQLLQKHDEAQEQYQLECQSKIITLETQIKKLRKKLEKQKKA